jgi:hypothetical protein
VIPVLRFTEGEISVWWRREAFLYQGFLRFKGDLIWSDGVLWIV